MVQIVDKNGNTSTDDGSVIIVDKHGIVKRIVSGGVSPTGPAGGDLSGTYPNPSVSWINGQPVYDLVYYPLSSNPAGYLTSSALTPYLTSAIAATTYFPIPTGTTSQYIRGDGSLATFTTYALPIATASVLGGVKIGSGVSVALDGTISVSTNYQAPLGFTPVTNARTLTINGTTYDLTADRTWTIPTFTSPLTTKGDLFTFNTGNTRLPIGSNTQILTVDTSTATGLKWAAPPSATPTGYYGAFQDNVTQNAALSNVGYAMIFRTIDLSNGISVVTNGTNLTRITFANTGIYNLQFSSQFQNTDNAQHDVTVWLRLNGTDVSGSSGLISVPARKSAGAGNEGHIIAGWNYVLSVVAGQYYELVWSTSNATNVTMQFYAAGSPPPSAASVIMTVTQQSGIMAGTGITAINSLTGAAQTLTTGTTGTDFAIVDSGTDHKFNLPTASAANRGALSAADWTTFNNKQTATSAAILSTLQYYNYKNTVSSATLTGTTSETQLLQVTIPPNSFAASDFFKFTAMFSKPIGISNVTIRFKLSTSATMPSLGASNIAVAIIGSATAFVNMDRRLSVKGGNIVGYSFGATAFNDFANSTAAISTQAFDPTVTNYFYVSANLLTITDSIYMNSIQITNI